MILALLLARQGVPTALLEAKEDFDRAFRGDTVHPSTLEMLDDLGLADPLLARGHGRLHRMTLQVTVQALWNVGTDFVLVPFAVISYALGDEAGAHEAIAA